MNFVAALLLSYLPEAEAFGGLVVLMQDRGLRRYYSERMELLQVGEGRMAARWRPPQVVELLRKGSSLLSGSPGALLIPPAPPPPSPRQTHLWQLGRLLPPRLCAHLESHGVLPSLYAASWLMTCFAADFPMGFSARCGLGQGAGSWPGGLAGAKSGAPRQAPRGAGRAETLKPALRIAPPSHPHPTPPDPSIMDVVLSEKMDQALLKVAVTLLGACERRLAGADDLEDILTFMKQELTGGRADGGGD
jgi:hypothetical protein